MAKRRNLKKEKALRNQAYARKFRKRTPSKFMRRPGFGRMDDGDESEATENVEDLEGGAKY